jgi:hypothetical protein
VHFGIVVFAPWTIAHLTPSAPQYHVVFAEPPFKALARTLGWA